MKVLVLNCGSSSIKFELFNMVDESVLSTGVVEKVGMKGSFLKLNKPDGEKVIFEGDVLDHKIGVEYILGVISSEKHGALNSLDEIDAVGHRVVHGGEDFSGSVYINEEVIQVLDRYYTTASRKDSALVGHAKYKQNRIYFKTYIILLKSHNQIKS